MTIQHPTTVSEPVEFTPTQIFEEYLPKILEKQAEIAKHLDAVCVFHVNGDNGGIWTVDLPHRTVKNGDFDRPDMRLEITSKDFKSMLAGKLDAVEALRTKRMAFYGRPQLLVGLAALMRPADN